MAGSGVARNLILGVYVLTSHCNFKTYVNVPHVNKTVTDLGIYTDIPPVPTPLMAGLQEGMISVKKYPSAAISKRSPSGIV